MYLLDTVDTVDSLAQLREFLGFGFRGLETLDKHIHKVSSLSFHPSI